MARRQWRDSSLNPHNSTTTTLQQNAGTIYYRSASVFIPYCYTYFLLINRGLISTIGCYRSCRVHSHAHVSPILFTFSFLAVLPRSLRFTLFWLIYMLRCTFLHSLYYMFVIQFTFILQIYTIFQIFSLTRSMWSI